MPLRPEEEFPELAEQIAESRRMALIQGVDEAEFDRVTRADAYKAIGARAREYMDEGENPGTAWRMAGEDFGTIHPDATPNEKPALQKLAEKAMKAASNVKDAASRVTKSEAGVYKTMGQAAAVPVSMGMALPNALGPKLRPAVDVAGDVASAVEGKLGEISAAGDEAVMGVAKAGLRALPFEATTRAADQLAQAQANEEFYTSPETRGQMRGGVARAGVEGVGSILGITSPQGTPAGAIIERAIGGGVAGLGALASQIGDPQGGSLSPVIAEAGAMMQEGGAGLAMKSDEMDFLDPEERAAFEQFVDAYAQGNPEAEAFFQSVADAALVGGEIAGATAFSPDVLAGVVQKGLARPAAGVAGELDDMTRALVRANQPGSVDLTLPGGKRVSSPLVAFDEPDTMLDDLAAEIDFAEQMGEMSVKDAAEARALLAKQRGTDLSGMDLDVDYEQAAGAEQKLANIMKEADVTKPGIADFELAQQGAVKQASDSPAGFVSQTPPTDDTLRELESVMNIDWGPARQQFGDEAVDAALAGRSDIMAARELGYNPPEFALEGKVPVAPAKIAPKGGLGAGQPGGKLGEATRAIRDLAPRSQEFNLRKTQLSAADVEATRNAVRMGHSLTQMKPEVRHAVHQIATGQADLPTNPGRFIPASQRTPQEEVAAQVNAAYKEFEPFFDQIRKNEQTLKDLGLIGKVTDAEKVYLRRQYYSRLLPDWKPQADVRREAKSFLMKQKGPEGTLNEADADAILDALLSGDEADLARQNIPGLGKASALFSSNLKARAKIPAELRRFMGEIEDGAHLAMLTLADQERTILNAKFYQGIAKDLPAIAKKFPDSTVSLRSILPKAKTAYGREQQAIIGPLMDQPMPRWLAEEIVDMHHTNEGMARVFGQGMGLLKRKFTSYNPSTHFNNLYGNLFFAHAAGISPANPANHRYFTKALAEMVTDGPLYREAQANGAISGTLFSSEGRDYLQRLVGQVAEESGTDGGGLFRAWQRSVADQVKGTDQTFAGIYDAEDKVFKLAAYIKAREGGMSPHQFAPKKVMDPTEAAGYVHTFFPNYDWLGLSTRKLRRSIPGQVLANPFIAFPAEAARVATNVMRKRPLTGLYGVQWMKSMANNGGMLTGVAPEEVKKAKAELPPYQHEHLMIPYRGRDGKVEFIDLTYKVPLASLAYSFSPNLTKKPGQIAERLFHAAADFAGGGFLKREIPVNPTADDFDKAAQFATDLIWPVPPSIQKAATQSVEYTSGRTKNRYGEPVTPEAALRTLTGTGATYAEGKRAKIADKAAMGAVKKEVRSEVRKAGPGSEKAKKARIRAREKAKNIREDKKRRREQD